MRNILFIPLLLILFTGCKKDDGADLPTPSEISGLTVEPIVGGAILRWSLPADSNFTYVEVQYNKKEKQERILVSKYTDSLVVTGLLNQFTYQFTLQTVHESKDGKTFGTQKLTSKEIKPIRRPLENVFYKINVKDNMLDAWTQEATEGPKANLTDGNISTYWHSAWSAGVEPLPHWIKVNFGTSQKVDRIGYYFRQSRTSPAGRPEKIAFETSEDGQTWNRVWTSEKLNVANDIAANEQIITLDKTYEAKHVRVMFLEVNGTTTYVNLGEFALYYKETTDLEAEAEKDY